MKLTKRVLIIIALVAVLGFYLSPIGNQTVTREEFIDHTNADPNEVQVITLDVGQALKYGDEFPTELIQEQVIETEQEKFKINLIVDRIYYTDYQVIDKKTVSTNQFEFTQLLSFISPKDQLIPLQDGKIKITISSHSDQLIKNMIGTAKIDVYLNDLYLESKSYQIDEDFDSNKRQFIEYEIIPKNILKTYGDFNLEFRLSEFKIKNDKNVRFELQEPTKIFSVTLENVEQQTIVKNEHGDLIKIYNIDVPFTFQHVGTSVPQLAECSYRTKQGCNAYYYTSRQIPAEPAPFSKLLDSSGNILAQGTTISHILQRTKEYTFMYGSTQIDIKVPVEGGKFEFSCSPHIVTQYIQQRFAGTMPYYWYPDHTVDCNFLNNEVKLNEVITTCNGNTCETRPRTG